MENYYTLFVRDENGDWHDEFGGSKFDCNLEYQETFHDTKRKDKRIMINDGTYKGLAQNYARLGQPLKGETK